MYDKEEGKAKRIGWEAELSLERKEGYTDEEGEGEGEGEGRW